MSRRDCQFLITGHGHFATGMSEAVKMIAGEVAGITAIPFLETAVTSYQDEIQQFMAENQHQPIICFTDLLGGTPYKTCVEFSLEQEQVYVLSGTNLGMLIEGTALRLFVEDAETLSQQLVTAGRENIGLFQLPVEETVVTEGI